MSNENENVKRIFEKQVEAVRPSKRRPKPKQLADQVISSLETKIVAAKIYLEKIEQALELPNTPREQLLQVKDLLSRFVGGVQAVQELPKNAPKRRDQLDELFKEAARVLDAMANLQPPFDVLEPDTWAEW